MKAAEQIATEALKTWTDHGGLLHGAISAAIKADQEKQNAMLDDAINRLTTTVPLGGVDRLMVRDILVKIRDRA